MQISNSILSGVPAGDLAKLEPYLARVALTAGQVVHRQGDVIDYVYFVESGLVSSLTILPDGCPLDVGLIGTEGVAGFTVVLGGMTSSAEIICRSRTHAYRMSASGLKNAFAASPALHDRILRFILDFQLQVSRTAACVAHHPFEKRFAAWLLAVDDRTRIVDFVLTHQTIAGILGVRRATVSGTAAALQRANIITYRHGKLTILDRVRLTQSACRCYTTNETHPASGLSN